MLPPVDPRVLERNPNFDILYKDLTTRKMNPDGSTRDTKKQRIHVEIRRVRRNNFKSMTSCPRSYTPLAYHLRTWYFDTLPIVLISSLLKSVICP